MSKKIKDTHGCRIRGVLNWLFICTTISLTLLSILETLNLPSSSLSASGYDRLERYLTLNETDLSQELLKAANTLLYSAQHTQITSRSKPMKVIVYAKLRTGSTFTSKFFANHPQGLYMYEILRVQDTSLYYDYRIHKKIFHDFFNCNFKNGSLLLHGQKSRKKMFCIVAPTKCNESLTFGGAEQLCDKVQFIVTKVIRVLHIAHLMPLMAEQTKVIHLMRDPRGVWSSRRKVNLHKSAKEIEEYCRTINNDLDFISRLTPYWKSLPRYYLPLHYEYLAAKTVESMHTIYKFLDVDLNPDMLQWAEETDRSKYARNHDVKERAFYTERNNAMYTSQAWRTSLPWRDVTWLQNNTHCRQALLTNHYTLFETEQQMLDFNVSSYKLVSNHGLVIP